MPVADVVRHLTALDFANTSSDVGILSNSATVKLNCAEALGLNSYEFSYKQFNSSLLEQLGWLFGSLGTRE
jgi:hypothetical protein